MAVARSFPGDTEVLQYAVYIRSLLIYRVAQRVGHFSTHHIFGTIQEKNETDFTGFWEQRLHYSFNVAVKYLFL